MWIEAPLMLVVPGCSLVSLLQKSFLQHECKGCLKPWANQQVRNLTNAYSVVGVLDDVDNTIVIVGSESKQFLYLWEIPRKLVDANCNVCFSAL